MIIALLFDMQLTPALADLIVVMTGVIAMFAYTIIR